jgi:ABC-2 type transport system ATP-binding protein
VLAGGRIVADDSPAGLAQRVGGTSEVRWTSGGERFVHATEDAADFLRGLLSQSADVQDLEVHRASLEDAYLALSQQHEAGGAEQAARRFLEVTR